MGATANRVVTQIVKETLVVIGAGVFLAWVIAAMLDTHLFAGGLEDAPVLLGVPLILMTVGTLACWLPARRATTVDPVVALRSE
jgi:ABC-type antimicrobial peptide transport system permease subunit